MGRRKAPSHRTWAWFERQGAPMLRHRGKARKAKKHSTARTPRALRYWEKSKQGAMLKHYPTFLDSTLLQRHLQSSSETPSHQTALSSKPGSACISLLFHYALSVILSKLSLAGLSALQCYPFPLLSPHMFSSALLLWYYLGYFSAAYYSWGGTTESSSQRTVGQHVPAKNHDGMGSAM